MTLLFEYAARSFDSADARHVRPAEGDVDVEDSDDALPVEALVSVLPSRTRFLAHPDRDDWCCVPLHASDGPELEDEYVVYEDHPIRGDVFVYVDADGDPAALSADEFAATALARRVRFWLPDFEPDELPEYAEHPLSREPSENPEDPDDLFDRLAAFVEAEREADRERNREAAARRTPGQRAGDGDAAIPEIGGFSRIEDARVRFHVLAEDTHGDVTDRFRIFEGNEVSLHSNDPDAAPGGLPVEATVDRIADFAIDLVLRTDDPDAAAEALESADSLGLSLLLNDLPTSREQEGVEAARSDPDVRAFLAGQRDATFAHETGGAEPKDPDLNERQELAATCALYADDAFCIHGPPGTGKTRTLVEVARRAVAAGERVLVCADSNQAVDNVLVGSSAEGHPDEGSLHYYADVAEEFELARHRADHSDEAFVRDRYGSSPPRPDVVATTNNSAAELDADFDLVIVDEATQATVTSTLISAAKGERLVLAGDHRQLPPFEAGAASDEDRHRSLFEHLYAEDGVYGHRLGAMLTAQYRMHEAIARFPADRFYDGLLEDGRDVDSIDGLPALVRADVTGSEQVDDAHSYANRAEAERVAATVDRLFDAGVPSEEIGVITPYDAQTDAIRDELDRQVGIEVDTVDSFQGGEREAIVVSLVRSNDRGAVGFLGREPDGPRRLNVALTRAERFLALVGDWETLRDDRNEAAELYRALYDYLETEGSTD